MNKLLGGVYKDTALCIEMSVSADDYESMKQIFKHAGFKNPLHKQKL